jgi:hypothetical protein
MQIDVGPARRAGSRSEIYSRPMMDTDFEIGSDGNLTLTIDAHGIKCTKSCYRYRIRLSADEVRDLLAAAAIRI